MGLLSGPFSFFFGPDPLGLCWVFFFLFPLLAKPRAWKSRDSRRPPVSRTNGVPS